MISVSIIDTSVVKISVYTGGLASNLGISIFSILVVTYAIGQYFILLFIKRKTELPKLVQVNIIHKIISTIQYLSIALLVIIILQMILTSSYSLFLLELLVWTNYGLSMILLGFLAQKFFSWYRSNHNLLVISYAIAMGILSVNAIFTIVTVTYGLIAQLDKIQSNPSPVSIVLNSDNIFNTVYVASSILSFIFVWFATVLMLRYYSKKLGTMRYWIIVSAPLFYFLSQFQVIFFDLFRPFLMSDPALFGIVFTLVFHMTKPIGGILFGVAFWIVSRRISKHAIKDYLIFSAFGIMLLFTSNQAISLVYAPYPPFGLVAVSFIGLSSYMLLIGIYSSAMSISRDSELRKFIRTIAAREFKLLDSIGSAQVEHELLKKVIPLVNRKVQKIEKETGIETSFTDSDIKHYLEDVLTEVRNFKKQ